MNETLRWGILSTGNIAHTFARALPHAKSGTLVAVGSRSQESADKFGDEFNIDQNHRHASYEALFADAEVDAVYIATPHPQHAEWTIKAAEAGKHVLCEKPLTLNYPTSLAVVETVRRTGVFLMEAFMYRCHPQTAKIVELIREGAIGEVKLIQATFAFRAGYNLETRTLNHKLAGGGILDVGCYPISLSRLIAGAAQGQEYSDPIEVAGTALIGEESRVDEVATASLLFPGGIVAQCTTGVQVSADNAVRIFGSEGSIVVPTPWIPAKEGGTVTFTLNQKGKEPQEIEVHSELPLYALEADAFAKGLQNGRAPYPAMTIEDTLGNMRALDRWRESIGLVYDFETPDGEPLTVRGEPLRMRGGNEVAHPMKYGTAPGQPDKKMSRLVMGCDNQPNFQHAAVMFDDFMEHGGNAFDTAYIYGGGKQEKLLGAWLKSRGVRENTVVISKGAHTPHCNPEAINRQVVESLERLQTDYADLYIMHRDNLDIPVGEFVDVLNEHFNAGRIRAFGGSNWSLARVDEANEYAQKNGLRGFECVSNNFSLARMVDPVWKGCIAASDKDSRRWFEERQMPLLAWSSQARGFFVRAHPDFHDDAEMERCWYAPDNFERLERVKKMAEERGVTPINIALAYVLNQPFPTFPLIGPRVPEELHTSLPGLSVELSREDLLHLNGE